MRGLVVIDSESNVTAAAAVVLLADALQRKRQPMGCYAQVHVVMVVVCVAVGIW